MTTARRTLDLLAAVLVGVTAGWALLAPLATNFAVGGSERELTLLATSRPLAAAVGIVLAAAVAGSLAPRRSTRTARVVVLLGLALIVGVVFVNERAAQFEWLVAANYVTGIAAGLALGGAAAVAVDTGVALTGGAFAAFALAPLVVSVAGSPDGGGAAFTVAPPWWLLFPAAAATVLALLVGGGRVAGVSGRGLATTAAVVVAALVTNAVIVAAPDERTRTAVLLAVFVAAALAAAFVLGPGDGPLLLVTTAIVAAAASLGVPSDTTVIGLAVLGVAVAAGVVAGVRWPSVVVALTVLAALTVIGLVPGIRTELLDATRWLVLAAVAGYALGSCGGAASSGLVAGLSVLFVPSALTVAGQAVTSDPLGDASPLRSLPRGVGAALESDVQWLTLAMTMAVLATIAAAGVLRQRDDR
ncbi:hypothetical protein ACFYVR_19585 [Rhodococcus sp. NPDC003318]|uniref:hypothetical protein n=1 Tax=Rhodococcus sp. NPDC003318 TaxID=3364503 RepID=UPI003686F376